MELATRMNGELLVLAPDRWKHYGKWRVAERPQNANYRFETGKVVWPWTGPGQFYLHWYPDLPDILKTFQPDVIDLWEEPWSFVSAQVCWLRNRLLPKARIISETEQNLNKQYPPPFGQFRAYTFLNADFMIGRSDEAVRVIRSQGYSGAAEVVPNAVDNDLFYPQDHQQCRDELKLDGFVVGYVGRIVERKGLMDLVEALPFTPPKTHLVFAGSGDYTQQLQNRLQEIGMMSRVRFIPEQPLELLPRLMNAIDVLALPSWTVPSWKEQFGRVIIEAHACGTPVIGSDSGAIPEVIHHGGLVFPERNPQRLAECITQLSQDPERCRKMGEMGRQQVLKKYTWGKIADQMHRIYQTTLRWSNPGC